MKILKIARSIFGLNEDPRAAVFAARWEAESDRSTRISMLCNTAGKRAIEKAVLLNKAAVPRTSPERTIEVSEHEFNEARELGIGALAGLRLVQKE